MPDLDLAVSVRNYAREQETALVSSAWLAAHFGVDPRTIAAALRPFGVRPGEVEAGVRGYSVAELAGIALPGEDVVGCGPEGETALQAQFGQALDDIGVPDVLAGRIPTEPSAVPAGWDLVDARPDHVVRAAASAGDAGGEPGRAAACADGLLDSPLFEPPAGGREMPDGWPGPGWHDLVDDPEADAIARLSAGAGHDMTPALRAAGLL